MDLPEVVKIGYADYRIERWEHHKASAAQRYGENSSHELTLRIDEELFERAPLKAANTVIHEILHGIYWIYGLEDDDKEERVVNVMANALAQVWRDNPKVVEWLNEQFGQSMTSPER